MSKQLVIGGFMGLFFATRSGIGMLITIFLEWVQSIGVWGYLMFIVMFLLVSFPIILGGYVPLTLGAGAIYGTVMGTITVSYSSTIGACIAFYICRAFTRSWVERKLKDTTEYRVFLHLLQSKHNKVVPVLARLSPIPFGLQNSFFALTDISFRAYLLSTWVGLLPFQIIWCHFGTTLRNLSKIGSGEMELTAWQKVSVLSQVLLSFLLGGYFWYLSRKIRARQAELEKQEVIKMGHSSAGC